MERLVDIALKYMKINPIYKQVNGKTANPHALIISNLKAFEAICYLTIDLPLNVAEFVQKIPKIGSHKGREQVKGLKNLVARMKDTQKLFWHFMNNEWLYDSITPEVILSKMSAEERKTFPFDMKLIDWDV